MSIRADLTPSAPRTAPASAAAPMNLGDFYAIVIGRLRLLAPCLAFALAIAFAYIVFTPARYSASMSILIDPRERAPIGSDAPSLPQIPDVGLVESQMRVLTSRAVLRRIVESEGLLDDPDFKPGAIGLMVQSVKGLFRAKATTAGDRTDDIAEALGDDIAIKRGERTYVIDVEVKAKSPEKAVALARALAAMYLQDQSSLADAIVDKQSAWLDGRLNDLRARVDDAERRVQDYRNENAIALSDGRLSPEQQLNAANAALVGAQGKRAEVEARFDQIKSAMARGAAAESIDEAIHSPVIEKLRADLATLSRDQAYERTVLGPNHPTYLITEAQLRATQGQIAAEVQRIFGATERELKAARAAERAAELTVANAETMTNKLSDRRVDLTTLERQAATLRASYEKMQTQREAVRRDIVQSPLAEVIDPPVAANARTSPRTLPALIVAVAGGVNLWIVAALLADYRERERPDLRRDPARLLARLWNRLRRRGAAKPGWLVVELPPLGAPMREGGSAGGWDFKKSGGLAAVEAMRAGGPYAGAVDALYDRLTAEFADQGRAPRLAVTSRTRGAGASTLALSLALSACRRGARVLLVDCHGDRPTLSALGGRLEPIAPGRRRRVERLFRRDPRTGGEIFIMASDEQSAGLPIEPRFDVVLLDCGPLAAAAYLVKRWNAADAVVVVDRAGADNGRLASDIKRAELDTRCAGVILTPTVEPDRRRA